mmetsp:Transcript_40765/g.89099  ORF Transcript_40765/g.89099 Transcript_40765/m.89099 type:complete len:239 (-) Transcript_40765:516-1232(-)
MSLPKDLGPCARTATFLATGWLSLSASTENCTSSPGPIAWPLRSLLWTKMSLPKIENSSCPAMKPQPFSSLKVFTLATKVRLWVSASPKLPCGRTDTSAAVGPFGLIAILKETKEPATTSCPWSPCFVRKTSLAKARVAASQVIKPHPLSSKNDLTVPNSTCCGDGIFPPGACMASSGLNIGCCGGGRRYCCCGCCISWGGGGGDCHWGAAPILAGVTSTAAGPFASILMEKRTGSPF